MAEIKNKKVVRPWVGERVAYGRRANTNAEFYNSKAWRHMAREHKRLNPLCVECEKEGSIGAAEVTDHITPINMGGAPLDWNNLQSLCKRHHDIKSAREAREGKGRGGFNP